MNKMKFFDLTGPERLSDNVVNLLCHELRAGVGKPLDEALADQVITVLYNFGSYKNKIRKAVQEAER